MIFQSLEFTGKRPFKDVLLHGLIRDEQGRKMSKSLGNGIDPMDVIDKYGADALRWFLSNSSTAGQDLRFSYDKMDSAWNFINKIWNASRYVIMNLDQVEQPKLPELNQLTLADKWILSRLNKTVEQVTHFFDVYDFGEAGRAMYTFIWDDFCDWYIEMSKEILNGEDEQAKVNTQNVLAYVLDQTLRLLHPVMPFVTEKIWLSMPHDGQSLVNAEYPVVHAELENQDAEAGMDHLIGLIKAVRNIRSEAGAPMSSPVDLLIKTDSTKLMQLFNENRDYIDRFCHPANFELGADVEAPKLSMSAVITDGEIYIPLAELVNLEDEIARLEKEEAKYEQEVNRVVKKLQNERFVSNAPEEVVAAERAKQTDYEGKLEATKRRLADIKSESK
jgi:valyl-tRNA synthetase